MINSSPRSFRARVPVEMPVETAMRRIPYVLTMARPSLSPIAESPVREAAANAENLPSTIPASVGDQQGAVADLDIYLIQSLRRALLAGRTETDNILATMARSSAILVMVWLELEMSRCKAAFETSSTSIPAYKKACMRCMRRLSHTHRILPQSFYMFNVVRVGDRALAGGGFADIWKGRVEGREVCLKVLRLFTTNDNRDKILKQCFQEALVWKQLNHPNVLPFLGVNAELFAPSFCLISPWMSHGNLMVYLETHPEYDHNAAIKQVADAMCYLHEFDPPVIHADIRGANILVGDNLRCYLADFGLASISESFSSTNTASVHTRGAIRWMAPEVLASTFTDHDDHERASVEGCPRDVYAFGCTILEIYTGKPPFSRYRQEFQVAMEVMARRRPSRPEGVFSDEIWSLIESCWAHDPSQRPLARNILAFLQQTIA